MKMQYQRFIFILETISIISFLFRTTIKVASIKGGQAGRESHQEGIAGKTVMMGILLDEFMDFSSYILDYIPETGVNTHASTGNNIECMFEYNSYLKVIHS